MSSRKQKRKPKQIRLTAVGGTRATPERVALLEARARRLDAQRPLTPDDEERLEDRSIFDNDIDV